MAAPSAVLAALERGFERTLAELIGLARIPSVSAAGFDPTHVVHSAEYVAELFLAAGLERVEVVRVPDAHPYVLGERHAARRDAPTVLLYAHHDVQPPGREECWETPAFDPTLRGDGRLYGRGVVDDKAGVMLHLAALRAWLEATGSLPVHVKFVVEGEEEIGSAHLSSFLAAHRERLRADVIVLSDTANLATGLPSLTTSLRGLVSIDVTVRALDHPLHSGMWGGPVVDAASALVRLLARMFDDAGCVAVPGLDDDVPELSTAERDRIAALPYDEASFRQEGGLLPSLRLAGDPERSPYERLWTRPAVAVTALEGMPLATAGNQLLAEARARVGVRLAPGQNAGRVRELLTAFLQRDPPWGARVETRCDTAVPGWRTEGIGPAFDAARRALRLGFEREPALIGCGGSIPFVGPFAEVLRGAPALLLGLEDPPCNAHGENESLDLEDFRKAGRAAAHLLAELSEAVSKAPKP